MADDSRTLEPRRLAPLFIVTTLLHLAALLSRFGEVAKLLPPGVAEAVLLAHVPLLLLEGYLEGLLDYGESGVDLPLWMSIKSRPVKLSFTFAFTYLGVVVLQTWNISIGPLNPSPPPEWPLGQRAMWFGIMSVGMFFPNYLATCGILIPILRKITSPFRHLPRKVGLPLLGVLGVALGIGIVFLLGSSLLGGKINSVQQAIKSRPALAIGVTLGMILIPIVIDMVRGDDDEGEDPVEEEEEEEEED
jgi:hypothetical protein